MSSNAQERMEVIKAYKDSPTWAKRVTNMTDAQVHAIYVRLKTTGKLR